MWRQGTFRFWSCYIGKVLNDLLCVLCLPSSRLSCTEDGLVLSICRIQVKMVVVFTWSKKPRQSSQCVHNKTATPFKISLNPPPALAVTFHEQQAPAVAQLPYLCVLPAICQYITPISQRRNSEVHKGCQLLTTQSNIGSHRPSYQNWCIWQVCQ